MSEANKGIIVGVGDDLVRLVDDDAVSAPGQPLRVVADDGDGARLIGPGRLVQGELGGKGEDGGEAEPSEGQAQEWRHRIEG